MNIIETKISTKGQITVPKEFRDKMKIEAGDTVYIQYTKEGILIKPKILQLGMLRGLFQDDITLEKADSFIKEERSKWRM